MRTCIDDPSRLACRRRHGGWRRLDLISTAIITAAVIRCADDHVPTLRHAQPSALASAERDAERGPSAAVDFDAGVPLAFYQPSLTFSKRTAGFTPPVQA